MKKIKVNLNEKSYNIYTGFNLDFFGGELEKYKLGSKILVITNNIVGKLYLRRVVASLKKVGYEVYTRKVPCGEKYKSLNMASMLYDVCIKNKLDRQSTIVALGGGVVGDLAGFVAATIFRGINFCQVPTTLLAQVDASIGGKVGINHSKGKNLIGAFYQPKAVFIDFNVLKTLPERELKVGLAEIIKYGVINDKNLFAFLEKNIEKIRKLDLNCLQYIIQRACEIKAFVVEKDEKEQDLRRILNYGHTAGHVLESMSGYNVYRHGEAVAIGMVVANEIACRLGIFKKEEAERIKGLIDRAGLPTAVNKRLDIRKFIHIMKLDKKVKAGKINFVLPRSIGSVVVRDDVSEKILKVVLKDICKAY